MIIKMRIVNRLVVAAIFSTALGVAKAVLGAEVDPRVASDTPDKMLTVDEIIAAPRPKTVKTPLPEDARIYIGSGVYANKGTMTDAEMFAFLSYYDTKNLATRIS